MLSVRAVYVLSSLHTQAINTKLRIAFYQQMKVVWHYLHSNNSEPVSTHTSAIISFSRTSTLDTNTGLRYFGHHTTWYLHEKVILQLAFDASI
jgi:hypothetical protein